MPSTEALPQGSFTMVTTEQWAVSFDFSPQLAELGLSGPPTSPSVTVTNLDTGLALSPPLATPTIVGNAAIVPIIGSSLPTGTPGPFAPGSYLIAVTAALDSNNTDTVTKQVDVSDPTLL